MKKECVHILEKSMPVKQTIVFDNAMIDCCAECLEYIQNIFPRESYSHKINKEKRVEIRRFIKNNMSEKLNNTAADTANGNELAPIWFGLKTGGEIKEVSYETALSQLTANDRLTKTAVDKMLKAGRLVSSDTHHFSTKRENVEKVVSSTPKPESDTSDAPEEKTGTDATPTPKKAVKRELAIGDIVIRKSDKLRGEVFQKPENDYLRVKFYTIKEAGKTLLQSVKLKPEDWRLQTDKEKEKEIKDAEKAKLALEKASVKSEALQPLTADEKTLLKQAEKAIKNAKDQLDAVVKNAPAVMARNLYLIRDNNLWREAKDKDGNLFKTFKDYTTATFDINDKYALQLAAVGGFNQTAAEVLQLGEGQVLDMSHTASEAMLEGTKKIIAGLGLGKLEFNVTKPIIEAAFAVLGEFAEKNEDGSVNYDSLTGRVIVAASEKMLEIVKTDTVTINGEQMSMEDAKAKNLVNAAFVQETLQHAAEGILTSREIIKTETKARLEENKKPPVKKPVSTSTEKYVGELPRFGGGCITHGKRVIRIGNGTLSTGCCEWRMSTKGILEPYEVNGKAV